MDVPGKYKVALDALVSSAKVPFDQQVEESDATHPPQYDESAGHLPGNVRPYGA